LLRNTGARKVSIDPRYHSEGKGRDQQRPDTVWGKTSSDSYGKGDPKARKKKNGPTTQNLPGVGEGRGLTPTTAGGVLTIHWTGKPPGGRRLVPAQPRRFKPGGTGWAHPKKTGADHRCRQSLTAKKKPWERRGSVIPQGKRPDPAHERRTGPQISGNQPLGRGTFSPPEKRLAGPGSKKHSPLCAVRVRLGTPRIA